MLFYSLASAGILRGDAVAPMNAVNLDFATRIILVHAHTPILGVIVRCRYVHAWTIMPQRLIRRMHMQNAQIWALATVIPAYVNADRDLAGVLAKQ